ncbi:hypothetical protein HW571_26845 [Agrobacterium genomosp. 3]|uniref:hypothetical protein n=1 Tax=Agrobacterium tomkonis TaxID=1183410 RepID=UPI001CD90706|nr:hypothetical protein [Agrobacterium tomkonis]MCA1879598.1 hypothetical protein [Agrobacterium tumefaciens]MCA1894816.1 hypothetical protein [Agrobacterium tomkonis]
MTEKLALQPDEPLSVKVERHQAAYLAVLNGIGGADMDQEAEARMEVIRHSPLDQEERNQKLLYVEGYLIASKASLKPEEMELLLSGSLSLAGWRDIDGQHASSAEPQ